MVCSHHADSTRGIFFSYKKWIDVWDYMRAVIPRCRCWGSTGPDDPRRPHKQTEQGGSETTWHHTRNQSCLQMSRAACCSGDIFEGKDKQTGFQGLDFCCLCFISVSMDMKISPCDIQIWSKINSELLIDASADGGTTLVQNQNISTNILWVVTWVVTLFEVSHL